MTMRTGGMSRSEGQAAIKFLWFVKANRTAPIKVVESLAAVTTKSHGLIIEALKEYEDLRCD